MDKEKLYYVGVTRLYSSRVYMHVMEDAPYLKRTDRRRKFTYEEFEEFADQLDNNPKNPYTSKNLVLKEIDPKYEEKMDRLERQYYRDKENEPINQELDLFGEHNEALEEDIDEALKNLKENAE